VDEGTSVLRRTRCARPARTRFDRSGHRLIMPTLTYREAAKRTGRAYNTIRHWRRQGMPMGWETRNGQKVRTVDERVLLKWWRERLKNWPAHQYRLRAQNIAEEAAHTPTRREFQGSTPRST
jgi:transposase